MKHRNKLWQIKSTIKFELINKKQKKEDVTQLKLMKLTQGKSISDFTKIVELNDVHNKKTF